MPERKEIITAMLAMLRLGKRGREKLEGQAFGQWLTEHRQSDRVIQRFYDPVLISALNEDTRKASSKYAIEVFQDAMLMNQHGYVVGLPACGWRNCMRIGPVMIPAWALGCQSLFLMMAGPPGWCCKPAKN